MFYTWRHLVVQALWRYGDICCACFTKIWLYMLCMFYEDMATSVVYAVWRYGDTCCAYFMKIWHLLCVVYEDIRRHLLCMLYEDVASPVVLRHQDMWAACTGCRQSKILMRYHLSSRANELLGMNRLRLKAAVGLLTDHTTLRADLHKLGHTERQECRLCGYDKGHSVRIVCDCPALACKRYRI